MEGGIVQELKTIRNNVMMKLADTETVVQEITFTVPHVLLNHNEGNGFPVLKLRQGKSIQVEVTVTTDWCDAPVDESKNVFTVKARNKINFGGVHLLVLNDEIKDRHISQSCPTASEYMDKVGKTVLISFACVKSELHSKSEGKNIFKVVRSTITLP